MSHVIVKECETLCKDTSESGLELLENIYWHYKSDFNAKNRFLHISGGDCSRFQKHLIDTRFIPVIREIIV